MKAWAHNRGHSAGEWNRSSGSGGHISLPFVTEVMAQDRSSYTTVSEWEKEKFNELQVDLQSYGGLPLEVLS